MKEYEVELGIPTTVLLSDEDADAQGLTGGKPVDDAVPPDHGDDGLVDIEGGGVQTDDDIDVGDDDTKSADEPKTKKRTAANK